MLIKKPAPAVSFIFVLGALGTLGSLTGCQILTNMDEMHDATLSASKATNEVESVAKHTDGTTEEVRDVAIATYEDLRQGNAMTIRSQRIQAMEATSVIDTKISEAGKYFMAFEFQAIKDLPLDSDRLQSLYLAAAQDFLRDLARYIPENRDLSPDSKDANMQNLYALGAALQEVNPNASLEAERHGLPQPPSMLTLIENALLNKKSIESGKLALGDLPAYQRELLTNEQDLVYLLRLRADFIPAIVLDMLHPGMRYAGKITQAKMALFGWDADLAEMNSVQVDVAAERLEAGNKTRDFLLTIGDDPQIDAGLKKVYGKMNLNDAQNGSSRIHVLVRLQNAVNDFLGRSK